MRGYDVLCFKIHYEALRREVVDINTGEHSENSAPVTQNNV